MKTNLKDVFDQDKRGLLKHIFVEQLGDMAILSYYGQGDPHEGLFSYDPKSGWTFKMCYEREVENLSPTHKEDIKKSIFDKLHKNGDIDIERVIVFYDKETEDYIGETIIDIDLDKLQSIFLQKDTDPKLFYPQEILPEMVPYIHRLIGGMHFDFTQYDYFLEAIALPLKTKNK